PIALRVAGPHHAVHSFPTRRSSDLERDALGGRAVEREARLVELNPGGAGGGEARQDLRVHRQQRVQQREAVEPRGARLAQEQERDRKSTRLNSSHVSISYAVFCWKK